MITYRTTLVDYLLRINTKALTLGSAVPSVPKLLCFKCFKFLGSKVPEPEIRIVRNGKIVGFGCCRTKKFGFDVQKQLSGQLQLGLELVKLVVVCAA